MTISKVYARIKDRVFNCDLSFSVLACSETHQENFIIGPTKYNIQY